MNIKSVVVVLENLKQMRAPFFCHQFMEKVFLVLHKFSWLKNSCGKVNLTIHIFNWTVRPLYFEIDRRFHHIYTCLFDSVCVCVCVCVCVFFLYIQNMKKAISIKKKISTFTHLHRDKLPSEKPEATLESLCRPKIIHLIDLSCDYKESFFRKTSQNASRISKAKCWQRDERLFIWWKILDIFQRASSTCFNSTLALCLCLCQHISLSVSLRSWIFSIMFCVYIIYIYTETETEKERKMIRMRITLNRLWYILLSLSLSLSIYLSIYLSVSFLSWIFGRKFCVYIIKAKKCTSSDR